jgi:hypothetical protein
MVPSILSLKNIGDSVRWRGELSIVPWDNAACAVKAEIGIFGIPSLTIAVD